MTKKIFYILLIVLISTTIKAQEKIKGNKLVTTVETEVNAFNKILIGEKFNVNFMKSNKTSVEIETDENLHDVIEFGVTDSVLSFKTNKRITSSKKMEILVRYTDALKEIELKDDAELTSVNTVDNIGIMLKIHDDAKANLNLKNYSFKLINNNESKLKLGSKSRLNINSKLVDLELNENSKVEALITCDSLNVNMYQRADAKIEGDANYMKINTINSTNFIGKNLTVTNCDAIVEDSSDFEIHVTDNFVLEASGTSEVSIYGNPKINLKTFKDTSKIQKKEL